MLYEMTAGRRPFAGTTVDEVAEAVRRRRLQPPPSAHADAVGPDARRPVQTFACRLLTAPHRDRPASAGAFAAALREVVPDA